MVCEKDVIYDKIKLGVQLLNGSIRYFDIDINCYIQDIYNLLLRFSFKFDKYFIYHEDKLIDAGTRFEAVEKLEECMYPRLTTKRHK